MYCAVVLLWLLLALHAVGGYPLHSKGNYLAVACMLVISLVPEAAGIQEKRGKGIGIGQGKESMLMQHLTKAPQ
jgi:hypothetical protein